MEKKKRERNRQRFRVCKNTLFALVKDIVTNPPISPAKTIQPVVPAEAGIQAGVFLVIHQQFCMSPTI